MMLRINTQNKITLLSISFEYKMLKWNDFCFNRVLTSMKKALKELSASTLRHLLIEEINKFIVCLDTGSTEELQQMKSRLREILELLNEKEMKEMAPLVWGKNSSKKS